MTGTHSVAFWILPHMKTTINRLLVASLMIAAASHGTAAVTITDDFNDGNDVGWTRESSLAAFGAGGVFTFPGGNTYQVFAPASPAPGQVGPARVGSVRYDQSYSSFFVQADVLDWDAGNVDMAMGLIGRANNFGLGTTTGYFLALSANGVFNINRTTAEAPSSLAGGTTVTLDVNAAYRMTFRGEGSLLTAQLFNLTDPITPIATVTSVDATYSSGFSGLFVYDGSTAANRSATAVFDNYYSAIPEPSALSVLGLGLLIIRRRRKD
jgi:hypothetical protein